MSKKQRFISILLSCIICSLFINAQTEKPVHSWAKTPPMGWNSWDAYGPTVTESEVKANADYMAKYMKKYGWGYIVVDIRWYIENDKAHGYNETDAIYVMDEYGRFLPSPVRFPTAANGKGFKPLADYIHSKGLKFGIHIMRGIPKEAVKRNTPVLGSKVKAKDIYNTNQLCDWLKDMYTVDSQKEGAQEYYNSLFDLYASWGLDFVKVDDLSTPYHMDEIELIRKAIDRTGRKIVLSTSPGETPLINAEHIMNHANMWRMVNDFWDNWSQLKEEFEVSNRWSPYIGNGHFPDGDMLPLGRIGIRAERGDDRMSKFSKEEQYTLMSLFSIIRSPLMFGGDLPSNDTFTLSLITNKEMLYINKYSKNNCQLFNSNDLIAWVADDSKSGDKFLAVFNAQDPPEINENKALWKSEIITDKHPIQSAEFDLDITGARKLYLAVSDNQDKISKHYADWIEPALIGKDTLKLTDLKWENATSDKFKVRINKNADKKPLIIDKKMYNNGIGTYGNSVITYTIPEGYTRFKAKAGLDDDAVTPNSDGNNAKFLVCVQNPAGDIPADSTRISVNLAQLGISGKCIIKDVWTNKVVGTFSNEFAPVISRHGAGLYRISTKK
jgi:alpha-galactosidase